MWSKIRKLFTLQTLVGFLIAAVLAALVPLVLHVKQDHDSLHVMVSLFNTCLARPDCKALFVAPPAPGK